MPEAQSLTLSECINEAEESAGARFGRALSSRSRNVNLILKTLGSMGVTRAGVLLVRFSFQKFFLMFKAENILYTRHPVSMLGCWFR